MKYAGMPIGMWLLFSGSFKEKLTSVLGFSNEEAAKITAAAKPRYKAIIADLPEFEKQDRFKMNIVNCAMIAAFILNMPVRPSVDKLTKYYADSMMTGKMRWFSKKSAKSLS